MKLLFENWRKFLTEKRWIDYNVSKGEWFKIPPEDIEKKAIENGGEIQLADELFALIDNAYAKIGGHHKLQRPEDLPGKYTDWVAVDLDDDPEPDATRFAKGQKMSGSGHDGTRAAIDAYLAKTAELLSQEGFYGEMSKSIAHVMIKHHNVPYVPSHEDVEKVLGKTVEWIGEHPEGKYPGYNGWYCRDINSCREMKIMVGRPIGIKVEQP